ncbi:MAG: hypothetical protein D3903_00800, partial [Candidatus Electrothrix sp. GM3_4]|nr:hypothetical protein [Candidatus Electrothrix sp. GM3_4]
MYDYLKYFRPQVLIGLISFVAIAIFMLNQYIQIAVPILGTITITLWLVAYEKIWSHKCINWMFWIDDISGRYEGYIKYQYTKENGEKESGTLKHTKIINQNGYKLSVTSFTEKKDGTKSSSSDNISM